MWNQFLDCEKQYTEYKTSKFIVVPCPHEKTTTYGKGTKDGPQAILDASYNVENFDEELKVETYKKTGIHTLKPVKITKLAMACRKIFKDKKIPITLGGEHSLTPEIVKIAKATYPNLGVIQFDAHADLRDSYNGKKDSHACAGRRITEICPLAQIGVRSMSLEEWECRKLTPHLSVGLFDRLPDQVYLTFDFDVLDPSIMPSTGTPEPGGLLWKEVLDIFKTICKTKKVIGADFVELMPIKGLAAPDFLAAKLIYRLMGYISAS